MVVKAAMIIMKIGIRTDSGISFRKREIITSEVTNTKVMAKLMPIPFATDVVTARAEQSLS
jgi:hypothetical protein